MRWQCDCYAQPFVLVTFTQPCVGCRISVCRVALYAAPSTLTSSLWHYVNWNKAFQVNVIPLVNTFPSNHNLHGFSTAIVGQDWLCIYLSVGLQNTEQGLRCKWLLQRWQWFMYERHLSDTQGNVKVVEVEIQQKESYLFITFNQLVMLKWIKHFVVLEACKKNPISGYSYGGYYLVCSFKGDV